MKDFLKILLATLTAMLIAGFIFFIYGISSLVSSLSLTAEETRIKPNTVFVLDLKGMVSERYEETPVDFLMEDETTNIGLDNILASIRKAKEHNDIKGIYINAEMFGCSPASMQAIRKALIDFKESGKFVVAYSGGYTQGTYYISSMADKVIVNPSGNLSWHGLSSQVMFLKELMDKIGVEMQIFKVGTYKSAVEPFIGTKMSDANREQTEAFIHSIWNQIVTDVAASRNISSERLNELADENLDFRPAEDYVSYNMADTLMYKDQVLDYLKALTGTRKNSKLATVTLKEMTNLTSIESSLGSSNQIAVYYAFGEIDNMNNKYAQEGIDSEKVIQDLRDLRNDPNVKAVVLRVNSPGGSAYGSEQMWREVTLLKEKKPVVVSMGDFAASGGYYLSCAADWIVAEPTTLTGSIGIFGMIPDVSKLLGDKLGIRFDGVKTNKMADMGDMSRGMNSAEKAQIQRMINQGYELFVKRCADGRHMTTDEIKKIAEGRVWTGAMAKELNLVDELGGLDAAIRKAAEKAMIYDYSLKSYPEPTDYFTTIFNMAQPQRYISMKAKNAFGNFYSGFELINGIGKMDKVQARMPFLLDIQ